MTAARHGQGSGLPGGWPGRPWLRCPAGGGRALLVVCAGVLACNAALAQPGIYTCTDSQGRKLTSDRPIAECNAREQRVLNRDGSLQKVVPPTLTAEERAEREAAQRKAELERAAQADAVRRDRNLVARFPNEAAHNRAREAALDTVRVAMKATEQRLIDLARERKPLLDEAEFYKGRQLPAKLKQLLDSNDAAVAAQRESTAAQEREVARINGLYDAELERLRHLWGGAAPGSLPPVPVARPTAAVQAPAPTGPGLKPSAARAPAVPAAPAATAPAAATASPPRP